MRTLIDGNYIVGFALDSNEELPQNVANIIASAPQAQNGYGYRLKTNLTWELYELPTMPIEEEEATAEDYEAALAELGVK